MPVALSGRSSQQLRGEGQLGVFVSTLWRFPLVYIFMFAIRFVLLVVFRPLFKLSRQDLSFKEDRLCLHRRPARLGVPHHGAGVLSPQDKG